MCDNKDWSSMIQEYEAGYLDYQHCDCHICTLRREEEQLLKCVDKSCDGCKNIISGKKIRNYNDVIMGMLWK